MRDNFFSLTLYFLVDRWVTYVTAIGDFALLGVDRIEVVDPTSGFVGTTTLDIYTFPTRCWAAA